MNDINVSIENFKLKYESFLNGCDSIEDMELWDVEKLGEMDAFYISDLSSIIIRLIALDGRITAKEVEYFNKTFGFEYSLEELTELYRLCEDNIDCSFDENFENGITYMRKINNELADAYKELLSLVCQIIIESDGIISEVEIAEVKRLKAMCEV